MTPSTQAVVDIAYRMMWTAFLLSIPVLLTSLVVGTAISLMQTVTGVQEMTITFVPKLAAVLTALALFLPWMNQVMIEFTEDMIKLMAGM